MCVQTVLQSDKDMAALLGSGQNFERWIKHGSSADDLINNATDIEEPALGNTHAMLHRFGQYLKCSGNSSKLFKPPPQPLTTTLQAHFIHMLYVTH